MSFHALWVYGAGTTTGLVWREFYRPEQGFWMNATVFLILTLFWPIFAALILYDWYKGRPMLWSKDDK